MKTAKEVIAVSYVVVVQARCVEKPKLNNSYSVLVVSNTMWFYIAVVCYALCALYGVCLYIMVIYSKLAAIYNVFWGRGEAPEEFKGGDRLTCFITDSRAMEVRTVRCSTLLRLFHILGMYDQHQHLRVCSY